MYRFGWFYGFFCLIVLATYTASLASFFVLSAAPPASAGVDDLRRDGVPFAVVRGSTAATFFDQPAYAARVNMVQVGTFGEGMLQVSIFSCFFCFKKKKKVLLEFEMVVGLGLFLREFSLNTLRINPPCDNIVVGTSDIVGPSLIGIGFSNNVSSAFVSNVRIAKELLFVCFMNFVADFDCNFALAANRSY